MEAEAKPHSFFRGWVKSALFSLILVPLALVLFLVHERLIAYYGPSPGPAWKSLLIALPEEAALACLVALFLGLVFEYFVQRRHAEDSRALLRNIDAQKTALLVELNARRDALSRDIETMRGAAMAAIEAERASMMEAAKQNLVTSIYRRKIPQPIFDHVENFLLKSDFVRKSFVVHITFQRVERPDRSEGTLISLEQNFQIHNVTDATKPYKLSVAIDADPRTINPTGDSMSQFQLVEIKNFASDGGAIGDIKRLSGQPLDELIVRNPVEGVQTITHPDIDVRPGGYLKVKVCHRGVYAVDGADMVCCLTPADGMEIRTTTPNRNYDIKVISMHPRDAISDEGADARLFRTWRITEAMFPGQGICYQWFPRRAASSAPVPAVEWPKIEQSLSPSETTQADNP